MDQLFVVAGGVEHALVVIGSGSADLLCALAYEAFLAGPGNEVK